MPSPSICHADSGKCGFEVVPGAHSNTGNAVKKYRFDKGILVIVNLSKDSVDSANLPCNWAVSSNTRYDHVACRAEPDIGSS